MMSFNNESDVQNQAGQQIIHGNVNFYNSKGSEVQSDGHDGVGLANALDDEILASLAFPEMLDRRGNVESPLRDTCQWIFELDEYQAWKAQPSGLLWIKGKPGAGKSTLMSHLYRAICSDPECDIHIEFFFSARGTSLQRTPLGMLQSLLSQIFQQNSDVRTDLRKLYAKKSGVFGKEAKIRHDRIWQWQRPELESLLTDAVLTSARTQRVTIFIDALDEAGEQSARQIARYFHVINDRVVKASTTAKICISCRHYPILATALSTEIVVEEHNGDDIAAYIHDYFSHGYLSAEDGWSDLTSNLIQQAAGIFQWACLVAPMVEKYITDGESLEEVRKWLQKVPQELGNVYEYILQNVIDPKHTEESLRLFQWVCLARRPLSVTEVRYALATYDMTQSSRTKCHQTPSFIKNDQIMALRIKSWSGGLIEVTCSDRGTAALAQVIHQSVNDFVLTRGFRFLALRSSGGKAAWPVDSVGFEDSELFKSYHSNLYWACLRYLFTEEVKGHRGLTFDSLHSSEIREFGKECPLLEYAAVNALTHAEKSADRRSQDLEKEAQLLISITPFWMHVREAFRAPDHNYLMPETTALHIAAAANMEDLVICLLGYNTGVEVTDVYGRTALHIAARCGRLTIAEKLIDAGADIGAFSLLCETPVSSAVDGGYVELFSLFWDQYADSELLRTPVYDALLLAASGGRTNIIEFFITAGAHTRFREVCIKLLEAASLNGREDIVRLLIEADVNAGIQNQSGNYNSALYAASIGGHEQVVQLLINAGADVDARGGSPESALQAAGAERQQNVARIPKHEGTNKRVRFLDDDTDLAAGQS